jgi:pimeloyl-ACP methyl ester carboxylesterase
MTVSVRNNVHVKGTGERAMLFAHGFGCDQNMWRFVAPAFEKDFKTVLFDHVGAGGSDLSAYDPAKYSTLSGYADDVVEIGRDLGLQGAVFVGHSVSSMVGVLASLKAPAMFSSLILVGPSARYIDDGATALTEPADSTRWVFPSHGYIADRYFEFRQALANGCLCSFKPQRNRPDALPRFHQLPELAIVVGRPRASCMSRNGDDHTNFKQKDLIAAGRSPSAHAIRVKRVGQKNADAEKDKERRDSLGHRLAPWRTMPGSAAVRNWR